MVVNRFLDRLLIELTGIVGCRNIIEELLAL
jgi:hypothetical protein